MYSGLEVARALGHESLCDLDPSLAVPLGLLQIDLGSRGLGDPISSRIRGTGTLEGALC